MIRSVLRRLRAEKRTIFTFDPVDSPERRFERSQLVAAWGEAADFYNNVFHPLPPPRILPRARYGLERLIPPSVRWRRGLDQDLYFKSMDSLNEFDLFRLERAGARRIVAASAGGPVPGGDIAYALARGRVLIRDLSARAR